MPNNGEILIANRHKGPFIFPRSFGKVVSSITIMPGCIEAIPMDYWDTIKNNKVIQFYLDSGHLAIVKKPDQVVDVVVERTSEPEVPPHLMDEEELEGGVTEAKAKVRRAKGSTITVGVQ